MSSLFHSEENIHKNNLSRAEPIPDEHLGFPDELHRERRRVCEVTFIVKKWQFMPGALPFPTFPPVGEP